MGKIISIWSVTGKTGKTVFLYMLINSMVKLLNNEVRILVCCSNLNYGNLLNLFEISDSELNIEDLVNLKISPDNKFDLLKTLGKKNNLYFLGSKKTNMNYVGRNIKEYENLIEDLKNSFDLILVDTIWGHENILTNMILDKSDHVVNVINQDKDILDSNDFATDKDLVYVVNKYRDIYPELGDIKSIYKLKEIYEVPDSGELMEMKNKSKLAYYPEYQTEYNRAVDRIAKFIINKAGLGDIASENPSGKNIAAGLLKFLMRRRKNG